MNPNPLIHPQNLLYCASSSVIVGTERGRLYLLASNAEQAAKYVWPTKTRKKTRYVVPREHLEGIQSPEEIEAIAHRYGLKDDREHICDVLEAHKSIANVIIETDALRWALTFLSTEGYRTVSIDNKGLSVESVLLGGHAHYDARILVGSRSLRAAIEQVPRGNTAMVHILQHRYARVLMISLVDQIHYVRDYYVGFTIFIGEDEK
jgi:hypothetical protein